MALLTNINGKFSVSDAGAVTFNNAFTFPTADGTANYVLKTNGSGQLAWAADSYENYDYWILQGDSASNININSTNTLKFVGGTYIDTSATWAGGSNARKLTINHETTSRTDTTSTDSPAFGGTFEAVTSVTTNTTGHITAIDVSTVTIPTDPGGTVKGTGTATRVAFWSASDTITSDADLYWDNTNNRLGIGTTTPQKKVHIEGAGGASEMQILVSSASDTVGHTAGIGLRGEGGEADGDFRIKGGIFFERIAGDFGNGKMILAVNSSVSNTSVTVADHALTIDTNKNVGIGTTSPEQKLHVNGQVLFRTTTADGGKNRFQLIPGGSSDAANLYLYYGNSGDGTVSVRINAQGDSYFNGGDVGIGVTSPGQKLHVVGNIKTFGNIFLQSNAGGFRTVALDTTNGADNQELYLCGGGTASSARGGQVGVYGNEVSSTGGSVVIVAGNVSTGDIDFLTANTQRMIINNSGNVGIGVTNPTSGNLVLPQEESNQFKIAFTGASSSSGISTVDQSGSGLYIGANSRVNGSGVITYHDSALDSSGIYFDGWNGNDMEFYTALSGSPQKRMVIDGYGRVNVYHKCVWEQQLHQLMKNY